MIKFPKLNRKPRIMRNLAFTVAIWMLWLIASDFASFTPEIAFRRLEKAYLSGPSDIMAEMDGPNHTNAKVIVSSYQDQIQISTLFKDNMLWRGNKLNSYKSHGDITIIPYTHNNFHNVSLFVAHTIDESVRAEITVQFNYTDNYDKKLRSEFTYEGQKLTDGLYYFIVDNQQGDDYGEIGHLIFMLGQIADKWTNSKLNYPIQLRFYSSTGELIKEETLELNSDYLFGN